MYSSSHVCHMGYSCQCDIYVYASISVNSAGYSVCLSPANSLRTDQVGTQQSEREGRMVGEGIRAEVGGGLWFSLNWLNKQGGEKQNKLQYCLPAPKIAVIASIFRFSRSPSSIPQQPLLHFLLSEYW